MACKIYHKDCYLRVWLDRHLLCCLVHCGDRQVRSFFQKSEIVIAGANQSVRRLYPTPALWMPVRGYCFFDAGRIAPFWFVSSVYAVTGIKAKQVPCFKSSADFNISNLCLNLLGQHWYTASTSSSQKQEKTGGARTEFSFLSFFFLKEPDQIGLLEDSTRWHTRPLV